MAGAHRIEVIDHTTGKTYESLRQASKDLYVNEATLSFRKKKHGNRFNLYGHDIELIESKVHQRSQKVRCVETGVVYESMTAASKAIGVSLGLVSAQIKGRAKHVKGFHFRRV